MGLEWQRSLKTAISFFRWQSGKRHSVVGHGRGRVDHVIVLDGTLSTLVPGHETNAGRIYRLLAEQGHPVSVWYEAGIQWKDWGSVGDVCTGRGIEARIRRAYGWLASHYRPGDRIWLFGYSRGGYAARSLAGLIDRVGLLNHLDATERNVRQAWHHYERRAKSRAAQAFRATFCHSEAMIEFVGVFETVGALGIRLPIFNRFSARKHDFHSTALGPSIRHGCQALALDETRQAFSPLLWTTSTREERARVSQMWFRGTHGDIGGQLTGLEASRPLSNIPLVWMLDQAESCGLALPPGWKQRFPTDAEAPSVGTWVRWGKLFLARRRRVVGHDASEALHESVPPRRRALMPNVWSTSRLMPGGRRLR